jgi:hypothetical protein
VTCGPGAIQGPERLPKAHWSMDGSFRWLVIRAALLRCRR